MFLSNRVYLKTLLSKEEIKDKVFSVISPINKPYNGEIYSSSKYDFKIMRNLNFSNVIDNGLKKFYSRNSFNPIIRGIIYEDQSSTIIKLNFSVQTFIKIFTTTWFFLLIIIGFPMIVIGILNQIVLFFIVPIAMFVFAVFIVKFGYKNEYIKSKKYLIELFDAEQVDKYVAHTSHNKR